MSQTTVASCKPIEDTSKKLTSWALMAANTAWEAVEECVDGAKSAVKSAKEAKAVAAKPEPDEAQA